MAMAKGLGKGLDALMGDSATMQNQEAGSVTLPISQVEPGLNQPRKWFDEDALADLAASIREHGIIQPLTVRRLSTGYYQIIAGERRWRAAKLAGRREVPVVIIEADDRKVLELGLIENLQREDLNPIEEANGYKVLMKDFGMSQEEVAQRVGKSRPAIANAVEDMEQYDAVLIGYPIWWGRAPKIIHTFLETYDLSGKTIATFCTSGGSGHEDATLRDYEPDATWLEGRRFSGASQVEDWVDGLDLSIPETAASGTGKSGFNFETRSVTLNSGHEMPINGLGTYSLHGETCVNSVKSALASGVRLIDTASAYGNEEEVGQAVRAAMAEQGLKREDIFVTTKIYPGSEMEDPEQSIQSCLDRLDLDYVDLMLLHHPDRNDVKAYQTLERFVEEGKIHSIGLSNWYVEELEEFLPQVSTTPALVQNEIHPYYQENEVIPYIQDLGIVVQGWYPLGGRGHTADLLGDEVISGIAKTHEVSSAQVILRWNLQKGVAVIPGSSNPDHIKENTELYDFSLTDEEMAQINALDRNEKHDWY